MAGNTTQNTTARINKVRGAMLKHAEPVLALHLSGGKFKMPRNQGTQIIYRRFLPKGGTTGSATSINTISVDPLQYQLQEGVPPTALTVVPQDIPVNIVEYGTLYSYSNRMAELFEDDVPKEQMIQCGETTGLLKEMIAAGTLKGCTNKFYAGGTSRATTDETVSLLLFRRMSRSILGNRGRPVTSVVAPGPNFNTMGVEQSFLVYCHIDVENDIRALPGFREAVAYGSRKLVHEMEIGAIDRYRFIVTPELAPYEDAGAAVAGLGLKSTTGTNADVYPLYVIAQDAWGDVTLRGAGSMTPHHIPIGQPSKADPMAQIGYVSNRFYAAAFIQNDGWMAIAEVAVSALS